MSARSAVCRGLYLLGLLATPQLMACAAPVAGASAVGLLRSQYSGVAAATQAAPAEVARFVEGIAQARGLHLQRDRRLAQIAQRVAEQPARLTSAQLELAVRSLGIYDPRYLVITRLVPGELGTSGLRAALEEALRAQPLTHYGAVWSRRGAARALSLVLSVRKVSLAPLPNSVPLHATLHLRGRLLDDYRRLRVEVLTARARALIPLAAGRELSVQLPAAEPGLQRIELRAEGPRGMETLAKLPVYVGQPFPSRPVAPVAAPARDLATMAEQLFESINRERTKGGLAALQRDARLDSIAYAHSVDMRDHDFVDHASARTGDALQRVAQAGLPTLLVLESVARAQAIAALEPNQATPADEFGNMLSRKATHVGIGVVPQRDAFGELLIATELFVELPERLDVASAAPRLLALVNEARVGRGAATVALDQGLCSVAARAAEAFVRDPNSTERAILAQADKELGRFSLSYRRVNALLALTPRLQDVAALEPALDPDASGIGIGIAQGERAGAAVLAIVMIVGTPR